MKPSSSLVETGLANSASSSAVVCGDVDGGIKVSNSPVWDRGSRTMAGRCKSCFRCAFVETFGRLSAGTLAVFRPLEGLFVGRGALLCSSMSPVQQKRPKLLFACGLDLRLSRRSISSVLWVASPSRSTDFLLCLRSCFCSISSKPSLSINVSTLVRSLILDCFMFLGEAGRLAACWSLCCQQYESGVDGLSPGLRTLRGLAAGLDCADFESGRLHGTPFAVRPRHVEAGFFESDRARRDSGVPGMNGIVGRFEEEWKSAQTFLAGIRISFCFHHCLGTWQLIRESITTSDSSQREVREAGEVAGS